MRNEHVYQNLVVQLDKLYRHTRQGSYQTRARYYEAMKRFCGFLADEYHLERLANLAPKHLEAYSAKLQREGKSASTIKTDLSAIRFFHDQMPSPRYQMLPSNSDLELERRSFGKEDRTWTDGEFQRMCALAELDGKEDYVTLFHLARYAGLRIHECFRVDTSMVRNAVRCGAITIIGKGGLRRTVALTADLRNCFHYKRTVRQTGGHCLKRTENALNCRTAQSDSSYHLRHGCLRSGYHIRRSVDEPYPS